MHGNIFSGKCKAQLLYPDSDVDEHGVGVELPADGDHASSRCYDPD